MITKLYVENFRSLVRDQIELGKITVLTGPNNSGKSSIIYALLVLKNIISNPNQSLDSCLNLGFINLGGFSQAVHLKDESLNLNLGIEVQEADCSSRYSVTLGKKKSELRLGVSKPELAMSLEVEFPYPANKSTGCELEGDFGKAQITWNGITPTINIEKISPPGGEEEEVEEELGANENLVALLSSPIRELGMVDFVPLRRGFVKPTYSSVPMQQQLLTEDELATLLATDRDLEGKVAHYLARIVPKRFNVRPTLGTANFNLQTLDLNTGLVCDLVNEGFGTNQLVALLTKVLRGDIGTVCIEESEIHLHPEAIGKLADVFVEVTKEEEKQILISTHSEHLVMSLLGRVAQKKLDPVDLKIYYLSKKGKRTIVEKQEVNEKGQIKGGLKSFYETELKPIKDFFHISEEA